MNGWVDKWMNKKDGWMKECVNNYKLARIFKQRRTYLQTCSVGVDPHLPTPRSQASTPWASHIFSLAPCIVWIVVFSSVNYFKQIFFFFQTRRNDSEEISSVKSYINTHRGHDLLCVSVTDTSRLMIFSDSRLDLKLLLIYEGSLARITLFAWNLICGTIHELYWKYELSVYNEDLPSKWI